MPNAVSQHPVTTHPAALAAGTLVFALAVLVAPATGQAPSEDTYNFFQLNCQSCHTIGGGALAGPDLSGVTERRERDWLTTFMQNPQAVIDSGDPYAQELLRKARGVYMPPPPGITPDLAGKLLDLIEYESSLDESRFAGLQVSDRPLTAEDVSRGRRLFEGSEDFASGAPACLSCHALHGIGGFGGGSLGPDLTTVYARLEGRKALGAWLSAPPSAVMSPVFRKTPLEGEEILALTAYLKHAADSGMEEGGSRALAFLLTGAGLAAAVLVLFDTVWRHRYTATRRPLVEGTSP